MQIHIQIIAIHILLLFLLPSLCGTEGENALFTGTLNFRGYTASMVDE